MKSKICIQKLFLVLFFSIVHISTNIVLINLKFRVLVGKIAVEGILSQNFVLGFSFYFVQKMGNFFIYIVEYFFLDFLENEPGPIYKI